MEITRSEEGGFSITRTNTKTFQTLIDKFNKDGIVPVAGVSPPFCLLLDGYCTLTGWFLIFFSRIFTLEADIFSRKQLSVFLVAQQIADTPNSYMTKRY